MNPYFQQSSFNYKKKFAVLVQFQHAIMIILSQ
jgi:hypothetical protein